eukprot:4886648-Pyramimonas_sp.AAC.2
MSAYLTTICVYGAQTRSQLVRKPWRESEQPTTRDYRWNEVDTSLSDKKSLDHPGSLSYMVAEIVVKLAANLTIDHIVSSVWWCEARSTGGM